MTKDDIIRMAKDVGLVRAGDGWTEPARWGLTQIENFAALVAAAEREACMNCYSPDDSATDWMDKMKARSQS